MGFMGKSPADRATKEKADQWTTGKGKAADRAVHGKESRESWSKKKATGGK